MVSATGTLAACSVLVWYGQAAPTTASPEVKSWISSEARAQYFLMSPACDFSNFVTASICGCVSSYGSVMPSDGSDLDRYRAASAIWMGLSGTVTWPLYFGS